MSGAVNLVLGSPSASMVAHTQQASGNAMRSFRSTQKQYRTLSLGLTAGASNAGNCSVSKRGTVGPLAVKTAVNSDQLSSSDPAEKDKPKRYHFLVANAKFMLDEEEHFKELLFERLQNYGERNKEQDFWLVIEPKFLDKFPNITKRLRRPAVALVSTNGTWITFMKLRLDRVLSESYEAESLEQALASNPTKLEFEKPEKWVAPYPKYEFGWWEPFLPTAAREEAKI